MDTFEISGSKKESFLLFVTERCVDELWYKNLIEQYFNLKRRHFLEILKTGYQNISFKSVEKEKWDKKIEKYRATGDALEELYLESKTYSINKYDQYCAKTNYYKILSSQFQAEMERETEEENKLLKDEIRHLVQSFADTTSIQVVGLLNRNACRDIKEQNKYRCVYPERYATENYCFDPLNLILAAKALSNDVETDSGRSLLGLIEEKLDLAENQLESISCLNNLLRGKAKADDHELEDSFKQGVQGIYDALTTLILGGEVTNTKREKRDILFPSMRLEY